MYEVSQGQILLTRPDTRQIREMGCKRAISQGENQLSVYDVIGTERRVQSSPAPFPKCTEDWLTKPLHQGSTFYDTTSSSLMTTYSRNQGISFDRYYNYRMHVPGTKRNPQITWPWGCRDMFSIEFILVILSLNKIAAAMQCFGVVSNYLVTHD